MIVHRLLLLLFLLNLPKITNCQGIKGSIKDDKGNPVPYATIYIENIQTGTTANSLGIYEIRLNSGKYKIVYKSLGYGLVKKDVTVNSALVTLDIILPSQVYQLKEVIINNGSEDPAYPIMRKVIAWAPYHLNQIKHYESEIYLKGTVTFDKIPKFIEKMIKVDEDGKDVPIKSNTTYIEESVNEITFDAPDKYHHKVKSSHSSMNIGNSKDQSPMRFVNASLYDPNYAGGISPLSPQAFAHYKFVYDGFIEENNQYIDKIKVIPKRKSQELYSGYIYIIEDLWCIYSNDLEINPFFGSAKLKQTYAPIKPDAWLPISHNFVIDVSFMGVKLTYYYTSSVKFGNIIVNDSITGPKVKTYTTNDTTTAEIPKAAKQYEPDKEIKKLMDKENLSKGDMLKLYKALEKEKQKNTPKKPKSLEIKRDSKYIMEYDTTKTDSGFWDRTRPMPLTDKEIKSFEKRDSLVKEKKVNAKSDSTKTKKHNNIISKIIFGDDWNIKKTKLNFKYSGLIGLKRFNFNTVDGLTYNQYFTINYKIDSTHNIWINPTISYAFIREAVMGNISAGFNYAPLKNGSFWLNTGISSMDFNQEKGISPIYNSLTSLFFRYNYLKLFEKKYATIGNSIDVSNGINLTTKLNYFEATDLQNNSDFSFFFKNTRDYTPNIPNNESFLNEPLSPSTYRSFNINIGLRITPEYMYMIEHGFKRYVRSRFPTFIINYKGALKDVANSNSDYQFISAGVRQRLKTGYGSVLKYNLEYGNFLSSKNIHFSEFKHFYTQYLPIELRSPDQAFQLLQYYQGSTSKNYVEGHIQYETNLLILKRLPFFSNRLWSENLFLNYLHTPSFKNYVELGYGLGNIFFLADVGCYVSFKDGKYQSTGVKLNFNLGR